MSAEGSIEDEPLRIRDSPTLPEEAEHSRNAVNDESNKDNDSPSREHHLMTTRELQLYWQNEKYDGKPVKLLFQIHSTRIAEDFLSKFVLYKIVIIKTGSFDGKKVFIERRYSDFERLHRSLLKDFKDEMEDVVFPKKILMGNLTEEIIRMRMLALKDYLGELYAIRYVRKSCQFVSFFIESDLGEGYSCIRGGQYKRATETLEKVLYLQEKLVEHCPILMVPTLCALVVCHKDMDQLEKAYETGMKALELLQKHPRHRYNNPLLDTLISLAYKLGKDFLSLREKLEKIEGEMITLKELVVKERVPTD